MKGALIILVFSILALFTSAKNAELRKKEKAMEQAIKNGFKDPVNLGNIYVKPGDGVLQVNQTLRNMIVTGLSKAHLNKVQADFEAGTVFLSYAAKRLTVYVDYELNGRCLFTPIWGKGKGVVVMDDVRVTANATVETVEDVIKITGMKITFDLSDGSFGLSSLFGESQPGILTPLYVKTFNANSKYIFNEILPPTIPLSEAALAKIWGQLLKSIQ